ncbi:glycine cleavage system protein T, partial [Burkholderia multivorans]
LDEGAKGEFGPRTTTSDEDPSGTITVGEAVDQLGYYAWMPLTIAGIDLILARTGYTGEDGFELYVPNFGAERLWDTLFTAGADHGLVPCGLAARDSLRLEAGMPLYGNELTLSTTPYDAGLGR